MSETFFFGLRVFTDWLECFDCTFAYNLSPSKSVIKELKMPINNVTSDEVKRGLVLSVAYECIFQLVWMCVLTMVL